MSLADISHILSWAHMSALFVSVVAALLGMPSVTVNNASVYFATITFMVLFPTTESEDKFNKLETLPLK